MVVDRHAHRALGLLLTHDVLGELVIDLMRRGKVLDGRLVLGVIRALGGKLRELDLVDHVRARMNALVADVDPTRARDELAHLASALATEGAVHLRAHSVHVTLVRCHGYSWLWSVRELMTLSTSPYAHASEARM